MTTLRQARGAAAHGRGGRAEAAACDALEQAGWSILRRRARTPSGEVDLVARLGGLVAFVEVKARPSLAEGSAAVQPRQVARLTRAAAILLAENPDWGAGEVRFDVIVVDPAGRVRRIADAWRQEVAEQSCG